MDSGADSGDILSQKKLKIKQNYDANVLYNKLTDLALLQIEEFIPILKNKNYVRKLKSTQSPIIGEKELKKMEKSIGECQLNQYIILLEVCRILM